MTDRQRILAAIGAEPVDRLPRVPRLDLWYKGKRYCNAMPAEWRDATLSDIQDGLGVGQHEVSWRQTPSSATAVGGGVTSGRGVLDTAGSS